MLAKDIADSHNKKLKTANRYINCNKERFKINIDIIDLKQVTDSHSFLKQLKDNYILTLVQIGNVNHIYLLSERGYLKLLKIFKDDKSWEI